MMKKTWGLMNDGFDSDNNKTDSVTIGNIRYYGSNPNNYIYFNCDDYSNQNYNTCEKWRIIGIVDGKIKIIRGEAIGKYAWDYTSTREYDNNWHDATLQVLLNNGYYNNSDGVSYYNGSTSPITINFKMDNKGIKNDETRKMISESTWYLGGFNHSWVYPNQMYEYERGNAKCDQCTYETIWIWKIGLMYSSDYGYSADLSVCNQTLYNYSKCNKTNWLYSNFGGIEWSITTPTTGSSASGGGNHCSQRNAVRPVLYLDSKLSIESVGDGSAKAPYQLMVS